MKNTITTTALASILLGLMATSTPAQGRQKKVAKGRPKSEAITPPAVKETKLHEEDTTLRLRFDVLELRLTAEDVERVNHAHRDFDLTALAADVVKRGGAEVKYSLGGPVSLGTESHYQAGYRVPFVRSTSVSKSGRRNSQVEYEQVGCILNLLARPSTKNPDSALWVCLEVESHDLIPESAIEISTDLTAPIFTQNEQSFAASISLSHDTYLWSLGNLAPVRSQGGGMLAYFYRLRLDPVAPE